MTKEMYEDLLERNRLQISELNTLTEEQDCHIIELQEELEKERLKNYKQLTKAINTPVFNQMGYDLYENEGYTELVEEVEQFLKEE